MSAFIIKRKPLNDMFNRICKMRFKKKQKFSPPYLLYEEYNGSYFSFENAKILIDYYGIPNKITLINDDGNQSVVALWLDRKAYDNKYDGDILLKYIIHQHTFTGFACVYSEIYSDYFLKFTKLIGCSKFHINNRTCNGGCLEFDLENIENCKFKGEFSIERYGNKWITYDD